MALSSTDALWDRWHTARDPVAGDELISRYLGLVYHAAREIAPRVRDAVSLDELVSAGSLGLVQAMNGFEPERGLAFSTFAMRRIRGAILDELRSRDPLTRTERLNARCFEAAHATCEQRLGRPPTAADIASHLDVPLESVQQWQERCESVTHRSLDEVIGSERSLAERVGDDNYDQHLELEREERSGLIRAALDSLPEREALILTRSYLQGQSLSRIATELNLTESRICQLRSQALGRLRQSGLLKLISA